jgi:hypothetical protein
MDKNIEQSDLSEADLGSRIRRETEETLSRAIVPVFAILVFASVQGIRIGFRASDYIFLIIGSIVSIIAMFAYGMVPILRARGSPKPGWMKLAAVGRFFPFLFLLYIFFYRGLWPLASLLSGFSLTPVIKAIVFCGLGYRALNNFHKIREIDRAMAALQTTKEAEKIVQEYGAVLASSALTRGLVADTRNLPHPKERIKQALVFALRSTKELQMREQLKSAYILLANYQEGVGDTTVGLDLTKADLNLDLAEMKKWWPLVVAELQALKFELEKQGLW